MRTRTAKLAIDSSTASAARARRDRLNAISGGLQTEVLAFNEAIRSGVEVRFPEVPGSIANGSRVKNARYGDDGLWVECYAYSGSYCLANDSRWDALLRIAGVARDPRTS